MLKKTDKRYSRFRFDAGSVALNFVATVRHRGSQPRDLLPSPEALSRWLALADLAKTPLYCSVEDHREALVLREAIHDTISAVILGRVPADEDIDRINRAARFPILVPQLGRGADGVSWDAPDLEKACLGIIARDAIALVGEGRRERLKLCSGESCRMIYLDTSPGNRRRWCAMSLCGNRMKVAEHRRRRLDGGRRDAAGEHSGQDS
ncbi:MAG: CGNR zinc finger domain-containing protein [Syntrophales bacterium]